MYEINVTSCLESTLKNGDKLHKVTGLINGEVAVIWTSKACEVGEVLPLKLKVDNKTFKPCLTIA